MKTGYLIAPGSSGTMLPKWLVPKKGVVPLTLWPNHFNLRLISVAIIITLKQNMHFLLYIDSSDIHLDVSVIIVPSSE